MRCGIMGTGNMGGMLAEGWMKSGALLPSQVKLYNRSAEKAAMIARRYPHCEAVKTPQQLAASCDWIFLCMKAKDTAEALVSIKPELTPDKIVITISSGVPLDYLTKITSGPVAKVIPSITNRLHTGASLLVRGERWSDIDWQRLQTLMGSISRPLVVAEAQIRMASDIACCGPAFISYILELWINAAVNRGISEEQAVRLSIAMLQGTAAVLSDGQLTPSELREKVSVPGGVTSVGLLVLQEHLVGAFEELATKTQQKQDDDTAVFT